MKRVLIFGTFDGLHEGHQFVMKEASKKGDELYVAVARDVHVKALKNKNPKSNEQVRLSQVRENPHVSCALLSDEKLGSYQILDEVKPDVIALGFDQIDLRDDLVRWMNEHHRPIQIEMLPHYVPNMG